MGRIVCRQEPSQQGENLPVTHATLLIFLQQLHDLDRASPQFYEQLGSFLRGEEYQNAAPNLQGEDLAWLVEYLDSVSLQINSLNLRSTPAQVLNGISDHASPGFQECLHELGKLCGANGVFPKSCTLADSLLKVNPLSSSGILYGSKVRVRRIRISLMENQKKVEVHSRSQISPSSSIDETCRSSTE